VSSNSPILAVILAMTTHFHWNISTYPNPRPCNRVVLSRPFSKQGASAGDRVYGLLFMPSPADDGTKINLTVEAVRNWK